MLVHLQGPGARAHSPPTNDSTTAGTGLVEPTWPSSMSSDAAILAVEMHSHKPVRQARPRVFLVEPAARVATDMPSRGDGARRRLSCFVEWLAGRLDRVANTMITMPDRYPRTPPHTPPS